MKLDTELIKSQQLLINRKKRAAPVNQRQKPPNSYARMFAVLKEKKAKETKDNVAIKSTPEGNQWRTAVDVNAQTIQSHHIDDPNANTSLDEAISSTYKPSPGKCDIE